MKTVRKKKLAARPRAHLDTTTTTDPKNKSERQRRGITSPISHPAGLVWMCVFGAPRFAGVVVMPQNANPQRQNSAARAGRQAGRPCHYAGSAVAAAIAFASAGAWHVNG